MTANVTRAGGVPDSSYGSARRAPEGAVPPDPPPEVPPAGPADLRDQMLVIEDDPEGGGFIYVVIDRRTGAVLQRLNRRDLLRLREAAGYAAGAVLSARA